MATITFSALPSLANITAATIVPVVAGNINYQVTAANLQSYVNGGAGNITSNNITATGVVQGATISATGLVQGATVSAIGNVIGGNIIFGTGIVSGTGNIFATNITATSVVKGTTVSATSNVIGGNLLTSGIVSSTGNINGNYLNANIFYATGYSASKIYNGTSQANIPVASGNIVFAVAGNTVQTLAPAGQYVVGVVSATGNITAPYFIGNGSQLSSLTGANVTGTVANTTYAVFANAATYAGTVTTAAQPNITSVGTLTSLTVNSGSTSLQQLATYAEYTTSPGSVTSSFTPNYNTSIIQNITAGSNFILNTPINMTTGRNITLIIQQDATGNRVMTPSAAYKFAYGVNTLSTAPNSIDMMSIFYNGSTYLCNLVKGYA